MPLYKLNPLEKFLLFTIYQNYTLALIHQDGVFGKIYNTYKYKLNTN